MTKNITVLLIGLKLTGYFNYSWWIVFTPIVLYTIIEAIFTYYMDREKKEIKKSFQERVAERMNKDA